MDAVLRAGAVYLILFALLRVMGKRTLAEVSPFDLLLLLIVSEATQQALLGQDFSITQGVLVIATLISLDRFSDFLSWRSRRFKKLALSQPLVLIKDGRLDWAAMRTVQMTEDEILQVARQQGLERIDQVEHVVLETSGGLSVIPRS